MQFRVFTGRYGWELFKRGFGVEAKSSNEKRVKFIRRVSGSVQKLIRVK